MGVLAANRFYTYICQRYSDSSVFSTAPETVGEYIADEIVGSNLVGHEMVKIRATQCGDALSACFPGAAQRVG
jgi:hypothetical protein